MTVAKARLAEERKSWRKDHPFGFVAKPTKSPSGEVNLLVWEGSIPGKKNTDWEGGQYPIKLKFPTDYPVNPPLCEFPAGFFHPNGAASPPHCPLLRHEYDRLCLLATKSPTTLSPRQFTPAGR